MQAYPLVGALFGLLFFREYRGVSRTAQLLLAAQASASPRSPPCVLFDVWVDFLLHMQGYCGAQVSGRVGAGICGIIVQCDCLLRQHATSAVLAHAHGHPCAAQIGLYIAGIGLLAGSAKTRAPVGS